MKAITETEKFNEYDRILEACINNIITTAKNKHHNTIYIDNFNIDNINDLLYLEMCNIAQLYFSFPIYIEVNLIDYIKLKIKNRKKSLKIKKINKKNCLKSDREEMMKLVQNWHKKKPTIYADIYNSYYNIKKEGNNINE